MKFLRSFLSATVILLLSSGSLCAATPEELAGQFFTKLKAGDYKGVCELFHPSAVKDVGSLVDLIIEDEDEAGAMLGQFFGENATVESVKKMSAMEKFKGFMGTALSMMGDVKWKSFKVLGTVKEGDEIRHVVVRMAIKMEDIEFEGVDVASMKKKGDSWGLLMKAEMSAMVEGIRKGLEKKKAEAE